jgi:hypothetical protein
MREVPEANPLEERLRSVSSVDARTVTNLILPYGNNLRVIKPDAKNASGVTAREIANESSGLPVPYLHDRVVTTTDDPFLVHANAPHKAGVGVGVTLEAKDSSLTGYDTLSAGTQNDSVATGFTYA